jgi:CxxC motif-containing protein
MTCTWCKKEIKDSKELVMDYINPKKKKNKQGQLKTKMPYHKDCISRKINVKTKNRVRNIVSGGLGSPN